MQMYGGNLQTYMSFSGERISGYCSQKNSHLYTKIACCFLRAYNFCFSIVVLIIPLMYLYRGEL